MAMSTPRARMQSHRGTIGVNSKLSGGNKPVIGLRPIKERNKRSEAMIEEQLLFMRETQNSLRETLDNLEKALTEDGFEKSEEDLQKLFEKSEELLVIVQVLMKIRNELAYARLDLERAIKSNLGVDAAKKRVKWLQDRLEKVLLTARSYCHLCINGSLQRSKTPQSGLKDQISEKLWNKLSEGQQKTLLESEERKQHSIIDNGPATPIVKEITKMQLPQNDSAESVSVETENRDAEAKEDADHLVIVTDHDLTQQSNKTGPSIEKRKQRKISDGSKGSGDETVMKSESNTMVDLFIPPTSSGDHHFDQESVTTFEPLSEPEEFDDHHSESLLSSVGVQELDEAGYDDYGSVSTEVTTPSEVINDGSHNLGYVSQ